HLQLGEHDDAAVDHQVGVRAVQQKEVREVRDGDAYVGTRISCPLTVQVNTVSSGDRHARQKLRSVEAGSVDDDVGTVQRPVGRDHTPLFDLGDPIGDQHHVVTPEGACPGA